jgi:hypothetical protein
VCECSNADCMAAVELTRDEYESVRARQAAYVVVPGHEHLLAGLVVARTARFVVVQTA